MMTKLIVILADGLGFHYLRDTTVHTGFSDLFASVTPVKSLLGYSDGIIPSIWTSNFPERHNHWARWSLRNDYVRHPIPLHLWEWKLATITKFLRKNLSSRLGKPTDLPSSMPSRIVSSFDYDCLDTSRPFYSEDPPSIFQILQKNEVNFKYSSCRRIEDMSLREISGDVVFFYLDEFDRLGHVYGPKAPIVRRRIRQLIQHTEVIKTRSEHIVLFSDHGMFQITGRIDILRILSRLTSLLGQDYLVFLDSTMARFWFFNETSEKEVTEALSDVHEGHFLTPSEIQTNGLRFATHAHGDKIFLVNPYNEIFPNFYHPLFKGHFKGLHGFSTDAENSYALLASTLETANIEATGLDIAPTILDAIDIEYPHNWSGKSVLRRC
jgi:predicted AlkP superfamily pyrophosphatase or phosphodiesterase